MPLWGPLKPVNIIGQKKKKKKKGNGLRYMDVQMLASDIKACQFTVENTHLATGISKNVSFDCKVFFSHFIIPSVKA